MGGAWGFFPYEAMDYKAAQAYLDRRAAAGWVLKKVHLNVLARFEPCEGRSHFVDLDLRRTLDETDPDYLQLCADAGWEKVQSLRGMLLFRSRPGTHPAPIQSDPGMEWERFWKQYVLKNLLVSGGVLLAAVLWLVLLAAALPSSGSALAPGVASNGSLLYGLMLVLMVLQLLWRGAATLAYFRACRKTGGLAVPGRGAALRGGLALAVSVLLICAGGLCIAESLGLNQTVDLAWTSFYPEYTATVEACRTYPVVMGEDLGLDSIGSDSRYLDGRRSVLADYLDYSEIVDGPAGSAHILTTERYDCVFSWLARWTAEVRVKETARGAFLWGSLQWTEAPELGFDQCWTAGDGAYLLLRQGRVTALVGCTGLDLTSPEILDMLWIRLKLEGT